MDFDLEKPSFTTGMTGVTFEPGMYAKWWRSMTPRERLDYVLGR